MCFCSNDLSLRSAAEMISLRNTKATNKGRLLWDLFY